MPRKRRNRRAAVGDYEVGYGRPPKHSQFKPGESGNPLGHRRPQKSLKSIIRGEFNAKVTVHEGGQPVQLTKLEVVFKALMAKAAKGDTAALRQVIQLTHLLGMEREPEVA